MSSANDLAAKMFKETRLLSQHDRGYILMCQFVTDIIGRRQVEGRLLAAILAANMSITKLPTASDKTILTVYIALLNIGLVIFSLYWAGGDNGKTPFPRSS